MADKENRKTLANAIIRWMESGVTPDEAAMHYIDSAFSYSGDEDFRRRLLNSDDGDTVSLYDLLFFPDMDMQTQLEPILSADQFDDGDVEAVTRLIQAKKIQSFIRFPDGRGELAVPVPDETVRRLVRRLKMAAPMDARIITAIDKTSPGPDDRYWIRVTLRNSRVPACDPFVRILCRCIETMVPSSAHFRPAFALLLDFLETADPRNDIYTGLMQKKQLFVHMIAQAERNEQRLEKASVEALMLTGLRISAVHVGETRKKIALIDHLCLWVFGKTDLAAGDGENAVSLRFPAPGKI